MAEELLEFENTVEGPEGRSHVALVLGRERDDGTWIGWIRFTPTDGGAPVETERETTQPNRDNLVYWSTGLTYYYLEGALARARRRATEGAPGGAARSSATRPAAAAPVSRRSGPPADSRRLTTGVRRLVVESLDDGVVEDVLEARDPAPGTLREVPDAGVVVYEGRAGESAGAHVFAVQFGSPNAGAMLANWLWSRLHGTGATVRVDGVTVEMTNDALRRALVG